MEHDWEVGRGCNGEKGAATKVAELAASSGKAVPADLVWKELMRKFFTPLRVGLLVVAAGLRLFFFLNFLNRGGGAPGESMKVLSLFHDATCLIKRRRAPISGIVVREIS